MCARKYNTTCKSGKEFAQMFSEYELQRVGRNCIFYTSPFPIELRNIHAHVASLYRFWHAKTLNARARIKKKVEARKQRERERISYFLRIKCTETYFFFIRRALKDFHIESREHFQRALCAWILCVYVCVCSHGNRVVIVILCASA